MADQNLYLRYKRDTRQLLYWMAHAWNSVIKSSSTIPASGKDPPLIPNTTGEFTVSSIVFTSKVIASHVTPIPSTIYSLFCSVIEARKAVHAAFQKIATKEPDLELERSNASHKHFIDGLTAAFETLGGPAWLSGQSSKTGTRDDERLEGIIFTNKFSNLNVSLSDGADDEDAEEHENELPVTTTALAEKSSARGKKGEGHKKSKKKKKVAVKEASLEEVPLESYRVIEDEGQLITDYLMAVYSLVQEWIQLRHYVQGLWREVAYKGLNSAVAGAVSNVAIAWVKQAQSAIFVEFPGHDSYETVMKTITRGDANEARGRFHVALRKIELHGIFSAASEDQNVDVKEELLIHAYDHLYDFINDFRATRSGKPTKSMQTEIRNWDPKFDLRRASKEQRLKWRRQYAINFLYDLVNLFSSIVVQRKTLKGQHWVYERVDWSIHGPWNKHRRLYGLNEFAGDITTLAMQKPGADVKQRILPHHVFQMQCILDSLTVTHGWLISTLRGHVVDSPAMAFRPRRDVDLFLDRANERNGRGYLGSVRFLLKVLGRDAQLHGDPKRHQDEAELLEIFQSDLTDWLGESKYMHGLTNIAQSSFSNTNSNGLWEYSPFLCGVGLTEALDLSFGIGLLLWDRMPEPMCVIHLHNMLVKKGYIDKGIGLYSSLEHVFQKSFFLDGKVPDSEFHVSFVETCTHRGSFRRRTIRRNAAQTAENLPDFLATDINRLFTSQSLLGLYRKAEWVPDRIPSEEVDLDSSLGLIRLGQTKIVTDQATGKKVLADIPLMIRAKAQGLTDEHMLRLCESLGSKNEQPTLSKTLASFPVPEGSSLAKSDAFRKPHLLNLESTEILNLLKYDIMDDITGDTKPLSSLNYTFVLVVFFIVFMETEDELKRLRNPLWVRAYEQDSSMMNEKRASLTTLVLQQQDDECMRVMAKIFERHRTGWDSHIFWDDLDSAEKVWKSSNENKDVEPLCSIM